MFNVVPSKSGDFEQREILWLEKIIQIYSPTRTVTIFDMHKSNSVFCTSRDTLAEINFRLKLSLKTSNFFVWKLLFRDKKKVEGQGAFRKFGEWAVETFSDWSKTQVPCDMAVIDPNQWVSMERFDCSMLPHCSMSPHLTVQSNKYLAKRKS